MDTSSTKEPESLTDTGEAMPLPRSPTSTRLAVQAGQVRKRRMARLLIICSSAVAIASLGIAYALIG